MPQRGYPFQGPASPTASRCDRWSGQVPGTLRQVRADLRREARVALVSGEFLQALLDQFSGAVKVTSLAGQPRPQEGEPGTGEGGMADKPVEAVFGLRASQPVQQQLVPFRKITGSAAADVIRARIFPRPPGSRLGRLGASYLVERVQIAVRENGPQVGNT